jgi:hypothetical protein
MHYDSKLRVTSSKYGIRVRRPWLWTYQAVQGLDEVVPHSAAQAPIRELSDHIITALQDLLHHKSLSFINISHTSQLITITALIIRWWGSEYLRTVLNKNEPALQPARCQCQSLQTVKSK